MAAEQHTSPQDEGPRHIRRACTQFAPLLCRASENIEAARVEPVPVPAPQKRKHAYISRKPKVAKKIVKKKVGRKPKVKFAEPVQVAQTEKPVEAPQGGKERAQRKAKIVTETRLAMSHTAKKERTQEQKQRYITPKYSINARMAKPHRIPAADITAGFQSPEYATLAKRISDYIEKTLRVHATPITKETLTDYVFKQCVCACTDAIDRGTFSIDYPRHCLNRIANEGSYSVAPQCHGLALVQGDKVLAWIFTDANGGIANFRGTLAAIHRSIRRKPENVTPFMRSLLELIPNFQNFVHIKIVVTSAASRGLGYAKVLMLYALLYWADRGKPQAFLNMALEKALDKGTNRVILSQSAASKRLYERFDFQDAYPKYSKSGEGRFSPNEGHQGRLMVNIDTPKTIQRAFVNKQLTFLKK